MGDDQGVRSQRLPVFLKVVDFCSNNPGYRAIEGFHQNYSM
jgi:hypothetical protein